MQCHYKLVLVISIFFRKDFLEIVFFLLQVVKPEALINYPPFVHRHGLVSQTLGLRFTLSALHFRGGSMRVKCVASVSPVLWQGDRESIVQSLPIKDMREALLLGEYLHQLLSIRVPDSLPPTFTKYD